MRHTSPRYLQINNCFWVWVKLAKKLVIHASCIKRHSMCLSSLFETHEELRCEGGLPSPGRHINITVITVTYDSHLPNPTNLLQLKYFPKEVSLSLQKLFTIPFNPAEKGSLQSNSCSAGQEISNLLRIPKAHKIITRAHQWIVSLITLKPDHTLNSYFIKTHFNIIDLPTPRSFK